MNLIPDLAISQKKINRLWLSSWAECLMLLLKNSLDLNISQATCSLIFLFPSYGPSCLEAKELGLAISALIINFSGRRCISLFITQNTFCMFSTSIFDISLWNLSRNWSLKVDISWLLQVCKVALKRYVLSLSQTSYILSQRLSVPTSSTYMAHESAF